MNKREREPTRLFISFVLFWSAYAPLALIIAIRDFRGPYLDFEHPQVVWPALGLAILGCLILRLVMRGFKGQHLIKVSNVQSRSNDLINYSLPYLACFLQFDWGKPQDVATFSAFMLLLFALSIRANSIFINPILAFFGYGLYEVSFVENGIAKSNVILSKLELNPEQCYRMDRITRFLCVVQSEIEETSHEQP